MLPSKDLLTATSFIITRRLLRIGTASTLRNSWTLTTTRKLLAGESATILTITHNPLASSIC